jgi:hypothetical protein
VVEFLELFRHGIRNGLGASREIVQCPRIHRLVVQVALGCLDIQILSRTQSAQRTSTKGAMRIVGLRVGGTVRCGIRCGTCRTVSAASFGFIVFSSDLPCIASGTSTPTCRRIGASMRTRVT